MRYCSDDTSRVEIKIVKGRCCIFRRMIWDSIIYNIRRWVMLSVPTLMTSFYCHIRPSFP